MAVSNPAPSSATAMSTGASTSAPTTKPRAPPAAAAAAAAPPPRAKRSRDPLSPKPILDRRLLCEALAARSIELKPGRLDAFYQLLHRQHYPSLAKFVEEYDRREKIRLGGGEGGAGGPLQPQLAPLKNAVSARPTKKNLHLLPKAFLVFLADPDCGFVTLTSRVAESRLSRDGTTTKMAIELQDGHVVESVVMRHVSPEGSRATLCVSSQVGCAMGCTFCATGTMGIRGNLTSGEILEQIVHAGHLLAAEASTAKKDSKKEPAGLATEQDDGAKENVESGKKKNKKGGMGDDSRRQFNHELVRNVVFMGMGEPLNNYENVVEACLGLIDTRRWNLKHGRVTVSTVGVTPKIRKLTRELPEVSLALSLHAPNQPMRSAIVPAAKAYPIEGLVDALDEHMMAMTAKKPGGKDPADGTGVGGYTEVERKIASKRKRAMIEYVMLEGDTSSFECAHQLGKLCENRHLIVNLIPYNQTDVKDKLRCPSPEHIKEFQRIVMSYKVFVYVRRTMGADIAGACGQLIVEKEQESAATAVDIEDGPFLKTKPADEKKQFSAVERTKRKSTKNSVSSQQADTDSKNDLSPGLADYWVRPLAIATAVAASCFALSTFLLISQRRRR